MHDTQQDLQKSPFLFLLERFIKAFLFQTKTVIAMRTNAAQTPYMILMTLEELGDPTRMESHYQLY